METMTLDNAENHPAKREFFYVTARDAGETYPQPNVCVDDCKILPGGAE